MAFADLFPVATRRDGGVEWRWSALLIAAALLSSFTFECVTPFAALAVLTAATMRLLPALAAMVAIWLVNQMLGFLALGYPLDGTTLAWGGFIGIAAVAATAAAAAGIGMARTWPLWSRIVAGFVAAFIAYEVVLFLVALGLGGAQNFTPDIVAKLALSDAGWLVGIAILRHGLSRLDAIWGRNRLVVRT